MQILNPIKIRKEKNIRSLTKVSGGSSFAVTIPIEYIRKLKWNGKDVYTVNKDGDIELKRRTKKDFDRIRVKGSLSNSMKVEKGVLNHIQSGTDKTNVGYNLLRKLVINKK